LAVVDAAVRDPWRQRPRRLFPVDAPGHRPGPSPRSRRRPADPGHSLRLAVRAVGARGHGVPGLGAGQRGALARRDVAALPPEHPACHLRRAMLEDRYGLSLSTESNAARDAYVEGVDRFLGANAGAEESFDRAI